MLEDYLLAMAEGDEIIIKRVDDDQWEAIISDDGFSRSTIVFNGKGEVEVE